MPKPAQALYCESFCQLDFSKDSEKLIAASQTSNQLFPGLSGKVWVAHTKENYDCALSDHHFALQAKRASNATI